MSFRRVILFGACLTACCFPAAGAEPVRIMPLGDSITQGNTAHESYRRALWHMLINAGYDIDFVGSLTANFGGPNPNPDFDLDHEGHWGWRAQLIEANVAAFAAAAQPDIALMHVGTNDALQNESTASTIMELGGIIDLLQAENPDVTIFLALILPGTHMNNANLNINIDAINAELPNLAATKTTADSAVVIVDQHTGFDTATMTYDGLHPNAAGEAEMAQRWFEALEPVLQLTQPQAGMPIDTDAFPVLIAVIGVAGVLALRRNRLAI